ncbi:MAG: hypothetical protein IIA54_07185 [Chloroflexi bacterium]|nr:hypothetical protein [Chloroflexota bacterium]
MKTVMLIGGGVQEVRAVEFAQRLGYRVVVTDRLPDAPCVAAADESFVVDGRDIEGLVSLAGKLQTDGGLQGVFTLTELVTSVAAVSEALELPGASVASAETCQDKGLAKREWLRQSIETPAGGVVESREEAHQVFSSLSGPGIIKPVRGFGAIGVAALMTADDVDRYFDDLTGVASRAWVVEELVTGASHDVNGLFDGDGALSTRDAGNRAMNAIAQRVHGLTGGSADLAPSTKTLLKDRAEVGLDAPIDHNMHFGLREHAMGSIANGMALHGGVIPYTATFLIFSDYMRPPMRLAALMEQRVIYVFTHDSVGLGEDGPTHQPVEQLLGLRGVPNLTVIRPADATETAEAWKAAIARRDGPTVLVLTRQGLPVLDRKEYAPADGLQRGGYVLWEASADPQAILIATGSEVSIALEAAKLLEDRGVAARVVSLPSWELFDAQPADYRERVLPRRVTARVSIEAATTIGWERYVGLDGASVGVDRFGASAPYKRIYEELGLTPEHVADEAEALVKRGRQ